MKIYSKTVRFSEILESVIFDMPKVRASLISSSISQISWKAISEKITTRSSDDIRHYWSAKILPLFISKQNKWSEADDLLLLEFIASQDLFGPGNSSTLAQST